MYKILIVDDESIFRKGLRSLIERKFSNIEVKEADTGLDALDIIKTEKIDGMFLDINMPKMDGLELLEYLKINGEKRIPTIIISGFDDFEYARRALRNEVSDYLLKPLTPNEAEITMIHLLEIIHQNGQDDIVILQGNKEYSQMVKNAIDYVAYHYKNNFDIAKMAEEFKHNANYLSQVFRNETGMGLNDYIRMYRIEKAKILLKESTVKISDIATEVGISNTQYFSTVFKALTGSTPLEYRENSNKK